MPTSLMHQPGYQRQPKQLTHVLADGNANKAVQQMRKRKLNDGQEELVPQVKTKIVPHSKLSEFVFLLNSTSSTCSSRMQIHH